MNMKYGELWGHLRSITQCWLDKAAPSPDRTGRAPLKEQQGGSVRCGPRPTAVSGTSAEILCLGCGWAWMLSVPSMEMPLGFIGFDKEHHRKMLGVQSQVDCKANCDARDSLATVSY